MTLSPGFVKHQPLSEPKRSVVAEKTKCRTRHFAKKTYRQPPDGDLTYIRRYICYSMKRHISVAGSHSWHCDKSESSTFCRRREPHSAILPPIIRLRKARVTRQATCYCNCLWSAFHAFAIESGDQTLVGGACDLTWRAKTALIR